MEIRNGISTFAFSVNSSLMKALETIKTLKFWKELLIMTLGMLVAAAGVYYFLLPSGLIVGSITGLSIVITDLLGLIGLNVRLSVVIFTINGILLLLAYFLIGKEFGIKTVYTALILGPMLDFYDAVLPSSTFITVPGQSSIMGDLWFDLCCFVLLLSASQAILFKINASTGGLDILAKIVNKYLHFDIGKSVSVAGALICCTAFAINPFRMVLIGLIGTWINGLVVDYFSAGLNRRKRVCIIADDHEKVHDFISHTLVRGCTLYNVTGGITGNPHVEIQALMAQDEFASLMKFISDNNIRAFITAGNVSEVYGLWYSRSEQRKYMK